MYTAYTFTDEQTAEAIGKVHQTQGYLLDPHGAVGYLALKEFMKSNKGVGAFLGTAHPAKFYDSVQPLIIRSKLIIPDRLATSHGKT